MNIDSVEKRVQAMVEDRGDGQGNFDFCDHAYLLPHLNTAYEAMLGSFGDMDLSFDEVDVDIPGVAIGTSNLSAYAASGQPLERMILPSSMQWKEAGDPVTSFLKVEYQDDIQNLAPDSAVPFWEFKSGIIYISAPTIAVDLRLKIETMPAELTEASDVIPIGGAGFILAFKTAQLVAMARGNKDWIVQYGVEYEDAIAKLESRWVKNSQGIVRRAGRTMRRGYGMAGGWPRLQT